MMFFSFVASARTTKKIEKEKREEKQITKEWTNEKMTSLKAHLFSAC